MAKTKKKKWVALFSQSGQEVADISKHLGYKPDQILTNNFKPFSLCNDILFHSFIIEEHDQIESRLKDIKEDTIVTLHGYLRILSPDVIENSYLEIYNGHPAPIHLYPELKGMNKQEDQFLYKEKYDSIGAVIHKVTSELDAGDIIVSSIRDNDTTSVDDSYNKLKQISLDTWRIFFRVMAVCQK